MSYVNEVKSLAEFVKTYSDNDIAAAIAEFKKKRISELTAASHSLNDAVLLEWKSRYGNKPIPRVIPESAMVLQKGGNNSCKFIKHLL
tara:strand:- start:264 stop:527 length:264 start_codon:yes stop_codon:yes gene_type:complete